MRSTLLPLFVCVSAVAACGGGGGGGGAAGGNSGGVGSGADFGDRLPEQFDSFANFVNNPITDADIAPESALTGTADMTGAIYLPTDTDAVNIIAGDMTASFNFETGQMTADATNFNEYETTVRVDRSGEPIIGTEEAVLLDSYSGSLTGAGTISGPSGSVTNSTFAVPLSGTISGTRDFGALGRDGFTANVNANVDGAFFQPGTDLQAGGVVTSGTMVFDLDNDDDDIIENLADYDTLILLSE